MEHTDAEERYRIVAELDGRIIGDAVLIQPKYGWTQHTGEIRCIVAHEFQGFGLGWLMINEMFQEATRRFRDCVPSIPARFELDGSDRSTSEGKGGPHRARGSLRNGRPSAVPPRTAAGLPAGRPRPLRHTAG